MSGIGELGNEYNCPLYISKDLMVERNGEGKYTFSGEIVNASSKQIKVEYVHVVAYNDSIVDIYGFPCTFDSFEIGAMENIVFNKELYYSREEDAIECDKKLFPNNATHKVITTVICKLEDGTEYDLKSREAIEDDKENGMRVIVIGLIGGTILLIIYIVKRVRFSKNRSCDI